MNKFYKSRDKFVKNIFNRFNKDDIHSIIGYGSGFKK